MLRREDITEERVNAWIAEGRRQGFNHFLTREQREAQRRRTLARVRRSESVWIFGYGSLIWAPAFHYAERVPALLRGWRRSFCFWTQLGRGTPKLPGLMLALERGGQCHGVAYRIPPQLVESETTIFWRREMVSGVYRPLWVTVRTPRGPVRAITLVINRQHKLYTGRLALDRAAHHIAFAEGSNGPCRDYLANTIRHLHELKIPDRELRLLWQRVVDLRVQAGTLPDRTSEEQHPR
ncbi:MAG: gamma-glutamylcyclotransferase [Reyranellaceae bacterium]